MANATEARVRTEHSEANDGYAPIAASTEIFAGCLAFLDANGRLVNAITTATRCGGVLKAPDLEGYDNSDGAAGDLYGDYYKTGRANFELEANDPPTDAYVGYPVYASDNQSVSLNPQNASNYVRPYVGTLHRVNGTQAEVDLDPASAPAPEAMGAFLRAAAQTLLAAGTLAINPYQRVYRWRW